MEEHEGVKSSGQQWGPPCELGSAGNRPRMRRGYLRRVEQEWFGLRKAGQGDAIPGYQQWGLFPRRPEGQGEERSHILEVVGIAALGVTMTWGEGLPREHDCLPLSPTFSDPLGLSGH